MTKINGDVTSSKKKIVKILDVHVFPILTFFVSNLCMLMGKHKNQTNYNSKKMGGVEDSM